MWLKYSLSLVTAIAALCVSRPASAQIAYDANVTVGNDGNFSTSVQHYLQVVTLAGPNGPTTINAFPTFGIRWNATATENQIVSLNFWTGLDTTPGASNVLAGATNLGTIAFSLTPQIVGSYFYNFSGVNIIVPSTTFAVEITMTNLAQDAFSTSIGGRLTTGSPSIGSNDGFIYSEVNDGIFAASERIQINGTSGNAAPTNYRMTIDATPVAAVPEPAGVAFAVGAALTAVVAFRRRRAAA